MTSPRTVGRRLHHEHRAERLRPNCLPVEPSKPPAQRQNQTAPTHSANFGVKLKEKLDRLGVPCELVYPGAPDVKHPTVQDYLIWKLKSPGR